MIFDRAMPRSQWALRLVVLLGPVVALAAIAPTDGPPSVFVVVLTLLLAAGWALVPESMVGVVTLLLVGFVWVSRIDDDLPIGALVAAAAMVAAHVAALLVSLGPPRMPIDAGTVRLWGVRAMGVFVVSALVWVLARGVSRLPGSTTVWMLGLAVALSVVVVTTAVTQAATPQGDPE